MGAMGVGWGAGRWVWNRRERGCWAGLGGKSARLQQEAGRGWNVVRVWGQSLGDVLQPLWVSNWGGSWRRHGKGLVALCGPATGLPSGDEEMTGRGPGHTDVSCPGFPDTCLWDLEAADTLPLRAVQLVTPPGLSCCLSWPRSHHTQGMASVSSPALPLW